jgi:hypothetical protein
MARSVVMSGSVATDTAPIVGQHAPEPSPGGEAFALCETGACVQAKHAVRVQPRTRQPWSATSIRALISDYSTAIPVIDIAARLGRSKGSIYGKAGRLGLRRPARKNPNPESAVALDFPTRAMADEIRALVTSADNPIVVTGPIIISGEEPKPEPPPPPAVPVDGKNTEPPRPYLLTPVDGRLSVWFPDMVERMMRLWLANVNHDVIAEVLGPAITGKAVQSKYKRVGLFPRHGLILNRDIEFARAIDRQAAPLPKVIRDHRNKPSRLRRCAMSGVLCYTDKDMYSPQYKQTKRYQNSGSAML